MNKEEMASVSQLLNSMKALSVELGRAVNEKDMERILRIKKKILNLQNQVDRAL